MTRGMAILQFGQALLQAEAGLLHAVEEGRLQHDVENRIADRHGERIAAEGRAVAAHHHALRGLARGEAGAHREAAADALGDRHDVGRRSPARSPREEGAGAADARLHLVEDEQQAVLVAQAPG